VTHRPASSPAFRQEAAKALRRRVPRRSHAGWYPPADRRDPIGILEHQELDRVQELLPIRHARMTASPFSFFRGTAAVMAADLASTPSSGLMVQACGDAHLANFGVYASPERHLVFDLNDFDETLPAPFEWDIKRLATSVAVCARDNGFSASRSATAARAAVAAYRDAIRNLANKRHFEVWYARLDVELATEVLKGKRARRVRKGIAKARSKTSLHALNKLTKLVDGEPRIIDDPPLIVHRELPGLEERIRDGFESYLATVPESRRPLLRRYRVVDGARKVVGVGSVGTNCSIALLLGDRDDDPLFLQVKEATASVLEPYAGPGSHSHQGQRVVHGQRLMQAASDICLGWVDADGRDAYVRQLRDMKGSADLESMGPKRLTRYAAVCGATLARAHARSGDAVAIGSYLGKGEVFDVAVAEFALAYAEQAERDHAVLVEAVRSGRMEANDPT
jgi:uncharacterized protein (DUF2252 family)